MVFGEAAMQRLKKTGDEVLVLGVAGKASARTTKAQRRTSAVKEDSIVKWE